MGREPRERPLSAAIPKHAVLLFRVVPASRYSDISPSYRGKNQGKTTTSILNISDHLKVHDPIGPGIYSYDDKQLSALLNGFSTVVASILPICSVVALYFVQSNGIRLGLTVLFCAIFATALVLVANASKGEVFAATTAYDLLLCFWSNEN